MKLPVNVIGLAGLVENMTGPAAMKLGDVLTARNGRTIEVHNTDAEGRLVLADVLSRGRRPGRGEDHRPGHAHRRLRRGAGHRSGRRDDQRPAVVRRGGRRGRATCGEPIWQLPMYPEIYDEQIKSEVADIKNVGDGRWGGAITAAKFLEQFVGSTPWAHLDIAGPGVSRQAQALERRRRQRRSSCARWSKSPAIGSRDRARPLGPHHEFFTRCR